MGPASSGAMRRAWAKIFSSRLLSPKASARFSLTHLLD